MAEEYSLSPIHSPERLSNTERDDRHNDHSLDISRVSSLTSNQSTRPQIRDQEYVPPKRGPNLAPRPIRPIHGPEWPLAYRKASLFLLSLYVPLLVIPWALTCVLSIRPVDRPSYINQSGQYSPFDLDSFSKWLTSVRVMNSVAGLVTVPIISSILAQAAIVYTQRHKAGQTLNLRQTFALADRGWSDISILLNAIQPHEGRGIRSKFLFVASGIILLSAIQQPIQQLLVSTISFQVPTCNDIPVIAGNSGACVGSAINHLILGYDPEPANLAQIPRNIVVQDVLKNLATVSEDDFQINLWPEPCAPDGTLCVSSANIEMNIFSWYNAYMGGVNDGATFFITALPNGTTTGVLREHAIRLNSSAQCSLISRAEFPTPCPGSNPFAADYSLNLSQYSMEFRVCSPGNRSEPPWTIIRDRQDVNEELYLDIFMPNWISENSNRPGGNFTMHCTSNSTRGYFELGNYQNDYTFGALLTSWPNDTDVENDFNDYILVDNGYGLPSSSDTSNLTIDWTLPLDPFDTSEDLTPGPLTTSAIALFGNESFIYTAMHPSNSTALDTLPSICQQDSVPFLRLDPGFTGFRSQPYSLLCQNTTDPDDLIELLYNWLINFNNTAQAEKALGVSMYFANQAYLTQTADTTAQYYLYPLGPGGSARKIFSSGGSTVQKPSKSFPATVLISVLIALQLIALAALAWYTYSTPTWTKNLDALAVARMGAALKGELPPIGPVTEMEMKRLHGVDGLVGVEDEAENVGPVKLGLGALGIIKRRHAKRAEDGPVKQEGVSLLT